MKKYRKKPVVVEAIRWTGENWEEVSNWVAENGFVDYQRGKFVIKNLEGDIVANIGDYIIKGEAGDFSPCKPDIFEVTYEEVEE